MTELQPVAGMLYNPPRVRVSATYKPTPDGAPENVEIEINDPGMPVTAAFIGEIVAGLLRRRAGADIQVATSPGPYTYPSPHTYTTHSESANGGAT